MGFSHIYSSDGLNTTWLSHGCVLETTSAMEIVGRTHLSRTECGEGPLSIQVNWQSHPLNDLSKKYLAQIRVDTRFI